jgi:ABC-2 type transport system permease protein
VDSPALPRPSVRLPSRWLPYFAVLKTDLNQTLQGWLFRGCLFVALVLSVGHLVHRATMHHQMGIVQPVSVMVAELLQYIVLVGSTLVIVLSIGAICGERDTLADTVLSRGVSRWQYFLAKWHARLTAVIGSFALLAGLIILAAIFVLQSDVSLVGCGLALGVVATLLAIVVSCGVAVSGMVDSSLLGIAILWIGLYALGAALLLIPLPMLDYGKMLKNLPILLRGQVEPMMVLKLMAVGGGVALLAAIAGMFGFSRRDL